MPLTLSSHPGFAVVPKYEYPKQAHHWSIIKLRVGKAENAVKAKYDGEFISRESDDRIFDIDSWNYYEGNKLWLLKKINDIEETKKSNGGRSFLI